jgi:hypothetical protein
MRRIHQVLILFAILIVGMFLVSCEGRYRRLPETGATLEGNVIYGKDKVTFAQIIVVGESSTPGYCYTDNNGHYKCENVPLGEVNIAISSDAARGLLMERSMVQAPNKQKPSLPKFINIPTKYADPATSDIKTTITKGANTFNIEIPK